MTISSNIRKAGPFTGNGSTAAFPFYFKVFQASDLLVVQLDSDTNIETTLALTTNYTVSLNADQDSNPGGTVTLVAGALAVGYKLTITSDIGNLQPTDLTNQGGFYPEVIEDSFDRSTIQIQQLAEDMSRALIIPLSSTASTSVPYPEANTVIGWNSTGTALENLSAQDLATAFAYSDWKYDVFTGDGTTTQYALQDNPGNIANLDVSLSGVTQLPGTDYTISGNILTFSTPPPNGVSVLARYGQAATQTNVSYSQQTFSVAAFQTVFTLSSSYSPGNNSVAVYLNGSRLAPGLDYSETSSNSITLVRGAYAGDIVMVATATSINPTGVDAAQVTYSPAGTGAVATNVQTKLRETVSVKDFGAVGDGVTSDATAFYNACIYCWQTGSNLYIPPGNYLHGRVEVHGNFNVIGSGATVEYLGVGTTYIAGTGTGTSAAPTAWPNDPAYDPSGYFNPVMYTLAATIAKGDTSFQVTSTSGLVAGQYLFIGGNPTSASSVGNYIPTDFEFVRISSIVGTTVNIFAAFKNAYTTIGTGAGAAAAFYSAGLAVNCKVSGLKINTSIDAYQYVVRSALNVTLEQLEFIGASATGASTFTENLKIDQWKVHYANGPISTARGTVSAVISNVEYLENTGGPTGLFVEESLYHLTVDNFNARNSGFSIRSLAMGAPTAKRTVSLNNCVFDATIKGDSPFHCGTASGLDFVASNCTFAGSVTTPNSSLYPSINGTALVWVSSTAAADNYYFKNCRFIAANSGPTWPLASSGAFGGIGGFLGNVEFDAACTFTVCSSAYLRPWISTLVGSSAAPTTPITKTGTYIKEGKKITAWCDFQAVDTTGATGNVQITGLPFQSANLSGLNFVGSSVAANLGSVATTSWIATSDTKIQILNGTTWGLLPMVAGAGKYLTCSVQYIAS